MHAYIYICMYTENMHTFITNILYTYIHLYKQTYIIHTYIHTYKHTHTGAHCLTRTTKSRIDIHTYIQTNIHAYLHTQEHTASRARRNRAISKISTNRYKNMIKKAWTHWEHWVGYKKRAQEALANALDDM
jgi:hypothetical protein